MTEAMSRGARLLAALFALHALLAVALLAFALR